MHKILLVLGVLLYFPHQTLTADVCFNKVLCKNGGTCMPMNGNRFRCRCPPPYSGAICEKIITTTIEPFCVTNPCKNDGICFEEARNCICPSDFIYLGKYCEVTENCYPNPCQNNGTCIPQNGLTNYKCNCIDGFEGYNCDESNIVEEDPCTNNPCKHGGVCIVRGDSFNCSCETPYSGNTCEEDPCTNNPCKNGGVCIVRVDSFNCLCETPYSGDTCEEDLCTNNPCKNEGRCILDGNEFLCLCKADFYGKICEKNPCSNNPCRNGGTCLFERNKTRCECKSTFSGEFCEKECNCGKKAIACKFDSEDMKDCLCLPGFSQNGGTCSECYCGAHSTACYFDENENKVCICENGFAKRNNTCSETCEDDLKCLHGGKCRVGPEGVGFCDCEPGFTGDRCHFNTKCDRLETVCNQFGASCVFRGDKAVCECPRDKVFKFNSGVCEDICTAKKCLHGICQVSNKKFKCRCDEGFYGVHCELKLSDKQGNELLKIMLFIGIAVLITVTATFISSTTLLCSFSRLRKKYLSSGNP